MNKIYLIKSLAPWMMDEILAFSDHTKFTLVLLRIPEKYYHDDLNKLKVKGVQVIIKPFKKILEFNQVLFVIRFILRNFKNFLTGYSSIIGWKSVFWFLRLDKSILIKPLYIHAQFATQAAIISLMIKEYFNQNVKYSFTFHAHDIYFNNKWFETITNESEVSFSISNFNINFVKKHYPFVNMDKIKLSRLGVFEPRDLGLHQKKEEEKITVGFLSWFVEKKGIMYLLEAIKIIEKDYPDKYEFIIAGNGPLKNKIISFILENRLESLVKYIGPVHGESKHNFFKSLDLFVLPSVSLKNDMDGIPVVLMEAVSYGVPLISTKISGIPEICINNLNGILIDEKSSNQIVNSILSLNKNILLKLSKNSIDIYNQYDLIKNTKKKIHMLEW